VGWYLRIDGEETDLVGGRLVWQPAWCGGRGGFVFHIGAHGGRRIVHVAGWAPGRVIDDLSNQGIQIDNPGPDAAVDGRLFTSVQVRFGRVTPKAGVVSIDGSVEDIDPTSNARAAVEADIGLSVEETTRRRFCLNCGANLDNLESEREEFVSGFRVRTLVLPVFCQGCRAIERLPRFCPTCGVPYASDQVASSIGDGSIAYTATCAGGHTVSGQIGLEER
jgi:hypothetical protein